MSKPIAYFSYTKNAKVLSFKDLSLNAPTSYSWDFGNGETSTDKNPTITYINNGFYNVTLISSNPSGASDELVMQIGVGETNETLNIPLLGLVNQYIPDSILGYSTNNEKINLIQKWQVYLQPLIYKPFEISSENTHNEFAWPLLANQLIAMLVTNDLMFILATRAMTSILTGSINQVDENSGDIDNDDNVKKITTGPTEVEFHDSTDQASNSSKSIQGIISGDDASILALKTSLCNIAHKLGLFLSGICDKLPRKVISPIVGSRYRSYRLNVSGIYYALIPQSTLDSLFLDLDAATKEVTDTELVQFYKDVYDADYVYYSYSYVNNSWKTIRVNRADLSIQSIARDTTNVGLDFQNAWYNRKILTYLNI